VTDDLGVRRCGAEGKVAGARRDVEHFLSTTHVRLGDEVLGWRLVDHLGDGRVVSPGPGGAVDPLEVSDGGHCLDLLSARFKVLVCPRRSLAQPLPRGSLPGVSARSTLQS
jgi:hypothetical protein